MVARRQGATRSLGVGEEEGGRECVDGGGRVATDNYAAEAECLVRYLIKKLDR